MSETRHRGRNLTKRYGGRTVVKGISFTVHARRDFRRPRPNGAGKTTTILMLLGLVRHFERRMRACSATIPRVNRSRSSGASATCPIRSASTTISPPAENLRYTARLIGLERDGAGKADRDSLEHVGSGGASSINASDLLARHATTTGAGRNPDEGGASRHPRRADIGPRSAGHQELLEIIHDLKERGVSVMLSSHLLERVQSVCDRVALFNEGNIALIGTVPELGRQVLGGGFRVEVEAEGQGLVERLGRSPRRAEGRERGRPIAVLLLASAMCVPKLRLRWSTPAGGCCVCGRGAEPGGDLHANISTSIPRRRAPCGVKVRPCTGSASSLKELADHLTSVRMRVLEWLVVLFALAAVYLAIQQVGRRRPKIRSCSCACSRRAREALPITFVAFLSILVPVMAIGLGFDAVNSEYNRRTLSRILSQPIYRDALLFGKFIAGLFTITISLVVLWLLVIGLWACILLGVPPSAEETARAFIFLLVTIAYAGVWLALALLFSIVFRSAATAALVTFGLWLLLTFLWPSVLAQMAGRGHCSPDPGYTALGLPTPETTEWGQILSRLSPSTLFGEIAFVLLNPDDVSARSLGAIYLVQLQGAARGALPLGQSLVIAWPDMVGLVAGTIVLSRSAIWCSSGRRCEPEGVLGSRMQ